MRFIMGYKVRLGNPAEGGAFAQETSKQETLMDFWIYIFAHSFPRKYFLVKNVVDELTGFFTHCSSFLCMYIISHEWYFKYLTVLNYQCELNWLQYECQWYTQGQNMTQCFQTKFVQFLWTKGAYPLLTSYIFINIIGHAVIDPFLFRVKCVFSWVLLLCSLVHANLLLRMLQFTEMPRVKQWNCQS